MSQTIDCRKKSIRVIVESRSLRRNGTKTSEMYIFFFLTGCLKLKTHYRSFNVISDHDVILPFKQKQHRLIEQYLLFGNNCLFPPLDKLTPSLCLEKNVNTDLCGGRMFCLKAPVQTL